MLSPLEKKRIFEIDRVKLPIVFDSNKILEEIRKLNLETFEYYDVLPLRAPAYLVDTSLPFPAPVGDYADGSWTEWMDTKTFQGCPYINEVVNTFKQHTTVNLVRILRLSGNSVVKEHTDPTLALEEEKSMIRLTIPVTHNPECQFILNGRLVDMKPGECWYLKLNDPHKVINEGNSERINLTIDLIPNKWIVDLIYKSIG
ncbi:aspartyl/asparaginyl beta-hydroxylase domain-containing protein [Algoriphagus namhaensis]|uniref:Aspartyl/asparaginyl beta-hydroxylase domain-containing protein n=1 Tax=Algoriphagus namhaensis TaxID=915353 RepID=A0ABV8ATM0_9BACT